MRSHTRPVESVPGDAFRPTHCPWPGCPEHRRRGATGCRFHRHGWYERRSDHQRVRRFRCLTCRRTYSQRTFSCVYYAKRPELLPGVAAGIVAGSALRQIARSLGCAHTTVVRLAAKLGRHAVLFQARALLRLEKITEAVEYDDFETFAYAQDRPFGMGTPVGHRSWFVYGLECSPHRPGGRRSVARRPVPAERIAPRGSYRRAFSRVLDLLLAKTPAGRALTMLTDDHPAYRAAVRGHAQRTRIRHLVFRNPERTAGKPRSAPARARDRALFGGDLLHMLVRHSQAHHRRETIAFGRRHNALMERGFVMAVWRNFIKGRSERKPDRTTPAMGLGLEKAPLRWSCVLARRLFPARIAVPDEWMRIYRRQIVTPEVGRNPRHRLVHAF